MANEAKTVSDLSGLSTPDAANTVLVVNHTYANGFCNTFTIALEDVSTVLVGSVPGPYANDATANTGGVAVGKSYYDSNGFIRVRIA